MPPRLTTDINWTTFANPVVVNYNNNGTVTFNGEAYKTHNQNPFWIDLTNGNWTEISSDSVDVGQYHRDDSALKDIVTSGKTIYDLAAYCAENNSRVTWHSYDSAYCNGVDSVFLNAIEKKELEVNESDWKSLFAATSVAGS